MNNQNNPQEVPQVKSVDTPKCKCGGRTALISGNWYFTPDREPYLNGKEEEAKVSDGEEWIIGYKCDDCGSLIDLFSDDRDGYQSRIAELEAENTKLEQRMVTLDAHKRTDRCIREAFHMKVEKLEAERTAMRAIFWEMRSVMKSFDGKLFIETGSYLSNKIEQALNSK